MGWLAVIAGIVGFVMAYTQNWHIAVKYGPYLSVAVLAGLDAVIGGMRAIQSGGFNAKVFLSGFIVTVIFAAGLSYFGDLINVPIWFATVFVFTYRILQNVGYMRRYLIEHEQLHLPHLPHLPIARRDRHDNAPPANVSTAEESAKLSR